MFSLQFPSPSNYVQTDGGGDNLTWATSGLQQNFSVPLLRNSLPWRAPAPCSQSVGTLAAFNRRVQEVWAYLAECHAILSTFLGFDARVRLTGACGGVFLEH
eukprot:GFKZ01011788.1.p2 GENE.GFKZ01011788.1~~GFKZ01011788.1.p2  ORF type:complete len:102 (-),score=4.61 GFKZ01011788.1:1555-1860(-)